ncbi:MAG TPA: hypothetical protein DD670_18115, partial [Planctomycetaceae bacterium]|nr:hypothetical protein [Planctomycetaceae bacterium]
MTENFNFVDTVNVAARLIEMARTRPDQVAVAEPLDYAATGRRYRQITFRELDEDSDRIAAAIRGKMAIP